MTSLGMMVFTDDLDVFAENCRWNIQVPPRRNILSAFWGMTGESVNSAGNLFPGIEEGMKNPPLLCISTWVICNSVIPHNAGIQGRIFTVSAPVILLRQELLNSVGKPVPTAQSSIALGCKAPHRRGTNSSDERGLRSLGKVRLERYFIFFIIQSLANQAWVLDNV